MEEFVYVAIRIWLDEKCTPMADLKRIGYPDNRRVVETIRWNDVKAQKEAKKHINAYTLIFDERTSTSRSFDEF